MRIVSLTLQGFKSFGDRTTIEFAPGVTAIVGPNGSGKSNVIDALRWTTGGGRASSFRAEDKTDLIFHGASGKRSVSLAEVEVELEAPSGRVKVWRSLDREGTTRLRLNGRSARFLDVEEALAGSGLGRSGLAVIGQGEVSQVLMADPIRLLEYVAEAAGAARLSTRRDQAAERLESAQRHLDKLQELLTSLEERERSLTAEAEGARRHAELSSEALKLRRTIAQARHDALAAELKELDRSRGLDEQALSEGRAALAQTRSSLDASRTKHDMAQERLREAAAALEARKGDLRVAEERLAGLRARSEALELRLADLRSEAAHLGSMTEPQEPVATLAAADADLASAAQRLRHAESEYSAALEAHAEAARSVDGARSAAARREREAAGREARLASLSAQEAELEERLERSRSVMEGDSLADLAAAAEAALSARQAAVAALERGRAELTAVHERQALAAAEAMSTKRAAERLKAAYDARRGYAHGPRAALSAGIEGVIGSVADLLVVEPEHHAAITAALGRRSEYVVADSAATAESVIAHVRRAGGHVTVLPLDLVRAPGYSVDRRLLGAEGVVGLATDLVTVDARFETIKQMLLGGTLVTEDMRSARAVARGERQRPRLVTADGDVIEPSGAMSGGKRTQQSTVLGLGRDLEEAELAAAEAEAAAVEAMAELEDVRAKVRAAQEAARAAVDRFELAEAEHSRAREARAASAGLVSELEERLAATRSALGELRSAPVDATDAGDDLDLAGLVEAAATAAAGLEQARSRRDDARTASEAARHERELLAERWTAYVAGRERFGRARTRLADIEVEEAEIVRNLAVTEDQVASASARLAEARSLLPEGPAEEERSVIAARAEVLRLEAELGDLTERQTDLAQRIEEAKVLGARKETALELVRDELGTFPDGVATLPLSERVARQRLREASEELERLGAVNHRAAGELAEVTARRESLEVEAVQATLATAELGAALDRIDRETSALLDAALERLRSSFGRHVQHLFGTEGRGAIEVDVDGGRPVGVRIRLQPPGKQTQSLHLLSVGERTMGALAFLFALMGDGGTGLPVAVLDEVDAPLDEANIRRFGTFLARLARHGTQFVLITHQKATFEVADTLWGVTTERGVSRVFSVRRSEEPARDRQGERDAAGVTFAAD